MEISKQEKISISIATFIILFASTSYYCKNLFSETANIVIMIAGLTPLLLSRKIVINSKTILVYLLLCLLSTFSSVVAGDQIKLIIYPWVALFIATLYVSLVNIDEFKESFSRIMIFLAVYAIVVYIVYSIFPNLIFMMPKIVNTSGHYTYNLFFAVATPRAYYRAEGFFWEPGVFQTFLNIAIPMVAFSQKMKNKKCKLVVLYLALIITFSTAAWVVGLINLFIIVLANINSVNHSKIMLGVVSVILLAVVLIRYTPSTLGGATFGVQKIKDFLNGPSNGSFDSASVRYDSVYYPIRMFLGSPIIGAGYNGFNYVTSGLPHDMMTCTIVNYFAMYGLIYGCLVMYFFYLYCKSYSSKRGLVLLIFLSLLLAMFSEQYVNYAIIDVLILYGISLTASEGNIRIYENR